LPEKVQVVRRGDDPLKQYRPPPMLSEELSRKRQSVIAGEEPSRQ
jgi:hypothetical protein